MKNSEVRILQTKKYRRSGGRSEKIAVPMRILTAKSFPYNRPFSKNKKREVTELSVGMFECAITDNFKGQ
jgi:hypothetical protein